MKLTTLYIDKTQIKTQFIGRLIANVWSNDKRGNIWANW